MFVMNLEKRKQNLKMPADVPKLKEWRAEAALGTLFVQKYVIVLYSVNTVDGSLFGGGTVEIRILAHVYQNSEYSTATTATVNDYARKCGKDKGYERYVYNYDNYVEGILPFAFDQEVHLKYIEAKLMDSGPVHRQIIYDQIDVIPKKV